MNTPAPIAGTAATGTSRPQKASPVPPLHPGETHTVRAELNAAEMTVFVDDSLAWEGNFGPVALSFKGPVGIRSDNARLELEIRAKKSDGVHPDYVRALQIGRRGLGLNYCRIRWRITPDRKLICASVVPAQSANLQARFSTSLCERFHLCASASSRARRAMVFLNSLMGRQGVPQTIDPLRTILPGSTPAWPPTMTRSSMRA